MYSKLHAKDLRNLSARCLPREGGALLPLAVGLALLKGHATALAFAATIGSVPFDSGYDKRTRQYSADYLAGQAALNVSDCANLNKGTTTVPAMDIGNGHRTKPIVVADLRAPPGVAAYRWTLKTPGQPAQVVSQHVPPVPGGARKACHATFTVKAGMTHDVELAYLDVRGQVKHREERPVVVRRAAVVVSVGDSYASGEGQPDVVGQIAGEADDKVCYFTRISMSDGTLPRMAKKAVWLDERAHRSLKSAPAEAARRLDLTHAPLTFVALGVSGATAPEIAEQVRNTKRLLRGVPVDALTVSAGGNDAGFEKLISAMDSGQMGAKEARQAFDALVKGLPGRLDGLSAAIGELGPRAVVWTGYPASVFDDEAGNSKAGCGVFDLKLESLKAGVGIRIDEARATKAMGTALNASIQEHVRRAGYSFVSVAQAFALNGYCTKAPFYVGAEESCRKQGDYNGVLHPNHRGVDAYADQMHPVLKRAVPLPDARASGVGLGAAGPQPNATQAAAQR